MRTVPKIALSLLISILLFSLLAVAAYAGLFNILETRFYQPTVIKSMEDQLGSVSDAIEVWHRQNTATFTSFINSGAVKRSVLPNQSSQDIFDRSNLAGALMADMPGLTGIRIIDSGDTAGTTAGDTGRRRIHFSTFQDDILKKEDFQISYNNYGVNADDIPFSYLSLADKAGPRVITDSAKDRFLYCFPFYDSYETWRGTAIFYVSARSASQYLVGQKLLRISDEIVLLTDADYKTSGIITGMPQTGREILGQSILARWLQGDFTTDRIVSTDSSGWVLLSKKTGTYGFTGQLAQESLFSFPPSVKILFLAVSFLTLYLVIFLFFNLKQDEMVVIKNRIRRFQVQLLGEVMEKNDEAKWEEVRKNLSVRKNDINAEIKKGLGRRFNKKHGEEIDSLLDKSWEEILSALGRQEPQRSSLPNTDDIRLMLEQVLQNNAINLNLTGVPVSSPTKNSKPKSAQKPVPEKIGSVDELGEIESVEELDEVESVEELDEVESAEELDEVESVEVLDEVESAEELDEVESAEELDEVESAEELDEVESVEELDEVESVEELDDVESVEELDEVESVEELDEVESVDELDEVESVEELDEVESAEELSVEVVEVVEVSGVTEFTILDEPLPIIITNDENIEKILREEPINALPAEPEEVEYLDGEWEPELLEVASEEEMLDYLEDNVPDKVLIYNFDEKPGFDSGHRNEINTNDIELDNSISIASLDFSTLDETETEEDATEVDYVEAFLLDRTLYLHAMPDTAPSYGFLEVTGDEEAPEELVELEQQEAPEEGETIVNRDGLFLVGAKAGEAPHSPIDPEFQKLVDSVL